MLWKKDLVGIFWVAPLALAALLGVTIEAAPPIVVLGAIAPAVAWAALVVRLARPREPLPLLAALFGWGAAVAAPLAETLNEPLGAHALGPVFWGPLVEEAAKAFGLLALLAVGRDQLRDVRSGVVGGALVGLGFAAAENLGYHLLASVQGGTAGLARAVFLRGFLQGLNHATFTATTGAGLALARSTKIGAIALPLAFAVAVAHHGMWNGIASFAITDLLCGAPTPAEACLASPTATALYLYVPAMVAIFIAPAGVVLVVLARRKRGQTYFPPGGRSSARGK